MQDFAMFDIIVVAITVILGLKGLFRGFIKEVFGLVGIVGGIFIASRISEDVGALIAPVFALENQSTINLIGFVVALVGFWIIIYILGMILTKIFTLSGLGIFNRLFGFIFGSAKVFLILAVISYAVYQVDTFKTKIDKNFSTSIVFPLLVDTGSYIVKLDTSKITKKVEEVLPEAKIDEVIEDTKQSLQKAKEATKDITTEAVTDAVKEMATEKVQEIKEVINTTQNKSKDN